MAWGGSGRHRITRIAPFLLLTLALSGCSSGSEGKEAGAPHVCKLAQPRGDFDRAAVPAFFELDDSVVVRVVEFKGGVTASGEVLGTVKEALTQYKDAVVADGFQISTQDYEGFEAELFLEKDVGNAKEIGFLSLREAPCEGKVLTYIKLVRS